MRKLPLRIAALLLMCGLTFAATPQDQSRPSLSLETALSLFAAGPAHEHRDSLMLFGQFVGSWDVTLVSSIPGEEGRFDGEWHFSWILQGRGVQDVWIVPKRRHGRTAHAQTHTSTAARCASMILRSMRGT